MTRMQSKGEQDAVRRRAWRMVLDMDAAGRRYRDIVAVLMEHANIKKRTAKDWIAKARAAGPDGKPPPKQKPEPVAELLTVGNFAAARWEVADLYAGRARLYREEADRLLADGNKLYSQAERLAISYSTLLAKLVHWEQLPPERLMSQPEVREQAMVAIEQSLQYMTAYELTAHIRACEAERTRRAELRAQGARHASEETRRQVLADKVTAVT